MSWITEREAKGLVCPLLPCDRAATPHKMRGVVPPTISLVPTNCITTKCMMWIVCGADESQGNCALRMAGGAGVRA